MERLRWGCLRESYIVTEYLSGQDLQNFLQAHPEKLPEIAQQIKAIFKLLQTIHTAHGDFKATNLWVVKGQINLLDLDGVKQYASPDKLQQALAKDKQRFLKNWSGQDLSYFMDKI